MEAELLGLWDEPVASAFPGARVESAVLLDGGNFTDALLLSVDHEGRRVPLVGRSSRRPTSDVPVERSGAVLTALTESEVPSPLLHWAGRLRSGRAGTLLRYIEGDAIGGQVTVAQRLCRTAEALAAIHAVPTTRLSGLSEFPVMPSDHLRRWIASHPRAEEALSLLGDLASVASVSRRVLVHGDYWTGNLLWRDGALVGVLDWDNVSLASPAVDVAKARLDLALTSGTPTAEQFVAEYSALAQQPEDQAFWDLRLALEGMPDPGRWWVPTYRLLGVDVPPETVRRNFEEYLEFCIDRLS